MSDANWSDDRVSTLSKLWTDGLSAAQIAKQLGGVSRNAVIGKVHRLGISGRATTSAPRPRLARKDRPACVPKAATAPRAAHNVTSPPPPTRPEPRGLCESLAHL